MRRLRLLHYTISAPIWLATVTLAIGLLLVLADRDSAETTTLENGLGPSVETQTL